MSFRRLLVLLSLLCTTPAWADTRVCVHVVFGELVDPADPGVTPQAPPAAGAPPDASAPTDAPPVEPSVGLRSTPAARNPYPLPPRAYLRRLLEHYVQHEPGFAAEKTDCQETVTVELYPTSAVGWSVFARYTAFESEERVDHVGFAEFPQLARRLVKALLFNQRIEDTISRTSVLDADNASEHKTVEGTHFFQLGVGSTFRMPIGGLPTLVRGQPDAPVTRQFRLVNPVDLQLGYRGDFAGWAVDAYTRLGIGVSYTDSRSNTQGGHVDHLVDFEIGLNLLWHLTADDVWSFYAGPGARFELVAFDVVEPEDRSDTDNLVGAGLSVVGIFGFEFLRTASVRPYTQLELSLPAYVIRTENRDGSIDSWMPGVSINVGALF